MMSQRVKIMGRDPMYGSVINDVQDNAQIGDSCRGSCNRECHYEAKRKSVRLIHIGTEEIFVWQETMRVRRILHCMTIDSGIQGMRKRLMWGSLLWAKTIDKQLIAAA
jgi:hypothetical protein